MANTFWPNEESLTTYAMWSLYEGIQSQGLMQNSAEDLPENDAVRRRAVATNSLESLTTPHVALMMAMAAMGLPVGQSCAVIR